MASPEIVGDPDLFLTSFSPKVFLDLGRKNSCQPLDRN